jgi:hypothetical protein
MAEFFAASLGPRQPANVLDWSSLLAGDAPRGTAWTPAEAFFAVLLSAITCDGEVMEVEREELAALTHRSRALKSLSPVEMSELSVRVLGRLSDEKDALANACEATPEDMRLPLFAHALDLVLADGDLTVDEADFLNALILNLKLDRDGVARVSDVITLKNRF